MYVKVVAISVARRGTLVPASHIYLNSRSSQIPKMKVSKGFFEIQGRFKNFSGIWSFKIIQGVEVYCRRHLREFQVVYRRFQCVSRRVKGVSKGF